jgi:hypothetical protein
VLVVLAALVVLPVSSGAPVVLVSAPELSPWGSVVITGGKEFEPSPVLDVAPSPVEVGSVGEYDVKFRCAGA